MNMQNFLFVDLTGLTPGKPFAGFAAGEFVDMNGREVEFKASTLKTFIANTKKAIEAAVAKGMPGLPIDARQHDKGDAAGWIVDASAGEVEDSDGKAVPVIMLAAEWTKLGLELLRDKIVTNFSPTVDLNRKTIRGGSLTNWPASVDGNGAPLFPAVELAQGLRRIGVTVELEEASVEDRLAVIRNAWYEKFGRGMDVDAWVVETFDDYIIASLGGKTYRVEYAADEEGVEFADRDGWVEVEQAWVEAQIGRKLTDAELGKKEATTPAPPTAGRMSGENEHSDEVMDMSMTKEELAQLVAEQVNAALAEKLKDVARPGGQAVAPDKGEQSFDVLSFLEMGQATDDVVGAFKAQMLEQYDLMKQRATMEAAEMIARIRRESDVAEFAQQVTGGSAEVPYGLPVGIDDLKEFLGRLQPADYQFAKKMLGDIQQHGRQKFAELGHGKQTRPLMALPKELEPILRDHVQAGGDVEEWFERAGIGAAAEYDLSQFVGEKK